MQRVCFRVAVRAEPLSEHVRRREDVRPDMQQALRETGWHNYSLFPDSEGTLIGYRETPGLEAALVGVAQRDARSPMAARWQPDMARFFTGLNAARPDEAITAPREIFHLTAVPATPDDPQPMQRDEAHDHA